MKLLDRERRKKKEVKKEGEKIDGVEYEEKTEDPSDLVVKLRSVLRVLQAIFSVLWFDDQRDLVSVWAFFLPDFEGGGEANP